MAGRGFSGLVMRGFGVRDHDAVVTDVEGLTPKFVRVRMRSPTLFEDAIPGPTAWLRFWFPDPDGSDAEHQRGYTITEADEEAGTFAIDIVLHEPAGPASAWGQSVQPGASISVSSSGSTVFEVPDDRPAGYLLVGDSASIPAISAIIDTVPPDVAIELYLEEHDPDDRLVPMAGHPLLRIHWVPRHDEESLAAAIETRDWSDWAVWAAPESGSLKHLRQRLRDEFGFPKSEIHARAYWYHGRAFGSRRSSADEPQRVDPPKLPPEPAAETNGHRPTTEEPAPQPQATWRSQAAGQLMAPLRPTLIAAGITQALVTLIQLAPFVLVTELARLMLSGAEPGRLWTIGIWAVVCMGAGVLLGAGLMFWLHTVDARFERGLRQRLLGKIARLPLGWFDQRTSGQVKQIVQDDTLSLHYLITHAVPDAVNAVVGPLAVLVYLFVIDWRVALVLFIPVLVYVFTMYRMIIQSSSKISQAGRWTERMNSEAGGYLEGQPVVRVFGGAAASTFRRRLAEYISFLNNWQRPFTGQKTLMDLATRPTTFLLVIVVMGTLLITTGAMEPISLLPFLLLGTAFGSRLLGIGYGLSGLRAGVIAARRLQVTLDERELVEHAPQTAGAAEAGTPVGQVTFDHVDFAYRPAVPVLQDISLTLEPGTVTALVGPSGSGKSTLAALLARFHDVEAGAIRIGGADVRELSADDLYTRVGFVFQQTQLVQGTVRENIALADPGASDDRVEAAARGAQIHDRILRLPQGYDTLLGPDAALSGGERQRLAIARALLADTPVLVLDEATAFADPESEFLVQQALNRLTSGRTVLVIAHRLHTIVDADRIVVLDEGRIVETGRHDELLTAEGRYWRLWHAAGDHATAVQGPAR